MNTSLILAIALVCLQARLTFALDLMGRLPLSERSSMIYRLNETREETEFDLTIADETRESSFRADELHVWLLTRDGGSLRKTKELQSQFGASNGGSVSERFTAAFEKMPASDIVAIVVAVRDRVLCFDGSKPDFRALPRIRFGLQPQPFWRGNAPNRPFPDGEYQLSLEWWHGKQEATLRVKGGRAQVIKSDDERIAGMSGDFSAQGDKEFSITFRTPDGEAATQRWLAQPDGAFLIKENPDRGENERAIRVAQSADIPSPPDEPRAGGPAIRSDRGSTNTLIVNGSFDADLSRDESGLAGESMFSPGSRSLPGWSVADGLVYLRNNPPSPSGGFVLELGPRDDPGTISQIIRTEPGKRYELAFLACAGRNETIKVQVANVVRALNCGDRFERMAIPFKAATSETTISISGVGHEGFGPMIDDVQVNSLGRPEDDLTESQRTALDTMTRKLKTGNSIADIARLKDSLNRWDELFINPAPAEMKPVFAILKTRVQERIAELEAEAAHK